MVTITQKGRAFSAAEVEVTHGAIVRFVNDDKFRHQIYIDAPALHFESDEQDPGTSVDVPIPVAGTFDVHCHIHPKMALRIDSR